MPNSISMGEQLAREWKNYYVAFVCKDEQTMRGANTKETSHTPKSALNSSSGRLPSEESSIYGVKNGTIAVSKTSNTAKILTGFLQVFLVVE